MHDWRTALGEVSASQQRLELTLAGLDEAALRAPSPLPGWTRGHVVRHIARNAASYSRLLEWAGTGVVTPQYPSREFRAEEIEAGAHLPYAELVAEVRDTGSRFLALARALPEERWETRVRALEGWPHPAWYTLYRRWREVEVHHVDLGAGYTAADWPASYVRWELAESLPGLRGAVPYSRIVATGPGAAAGLTVDLDGPGPELRDSGTVLLGWVTGRGPAPYAPVPPWPYPAAVDWSKA